MTHDELMALPESGDFGSVESIVDGKRFLRPVAHQAFALFHKEDDPLIVFDHNGESWTVGWANGIRGVAAV